MSLPRAIRSFALACLLAGPAVHAADGFELVTPDQAAAEARFEADHPGLAVPSRVRGTDSLPRVRIVSPETAAAQPVNSPVRIELAFETYGDAHIVPSSFRVLYGFMRIDLTDKVLKNATISEHGLLAAHADIPAGSHRLLLQIADDKGRASEQELLLKVVR